MTSHASSPSGPGLKSVLGLSALVFYGIILIQPTAPMPLYGAASQSCKRSCSYNHTYRHGCHAFHCDQLRTYGKCLSECRVCIYICEQGNTSFTRVLCWLGNDFRLYYESYHMCDLDQQGCNKLNS